MVDEKTGSCWETTCIVDLVRLSGTSQLQDLVGRIERLTSERERGGGGGVEK